MSLFSLTPKKKKPNFQTGYCMSIFPLWQNIWKKKNSSEKERLVWPHGFRGSVHSSLATLFLDLWGARIPSGKRRTCLHRADRRHGWGQGQKSYFKRKIFPLSRSPFLMFPPPSKLYHRQTKPSTHEFWGTFNEQTGEITFLDAGYFDFNTLSPRTQFSLCSTLANL